MPGCPKDYADEVWSIIPAVELMEQGILPVSGGWLDQTQSFLDAARFFRRERDAALATEK